MLATALLACGTGVTAAATGGGGGSFGLPFAVGAIATYAIAAAILAVGLLTLALIVTLSRRGIGAPAQVPVPVGATISPDGLYWWDGATWRPILR